MDGSQHQSSGLHAAFDLRSKAPLGWADLSADRSIDRAGPTWALLDRRAPEAARWLRAQPGIDAISAESLLADATRPRAIVSDTGLLLILRGANLNPGAEPEDMLSVRIWATRDRMIALVGGRLRAVWAIVDDLNEGRGPDSIGELLARIVSGLAERLDPVVAAIAETLDELEDRVIDPDQTVPRHELIAIRRRAIALHRYIAPQVGALQQLQSERIEWIDPPQRRVLKEAANRMTRYVEDIEAARHRSGVIQDELANQLAERTNRRMYAITIIAAIFLPLTLVTGLLGMNVGGVPLAQTPAGFWAVTAGVAAAGALGWALAVRLRWL